jgi:hypothetical protein
MKDINVEIEVACDAGTNACLKYTTKIRVMLTRTVGVHPAKR